MHTQRHTKPLKDTDGGKTMKIPWMKWVTAAKGGVSHGEEEKKGS